MRQNIKQRKAEGFTIIEVMIVLAIAGLIMLIVFLAVPALQRNSRNTQIKNDAGNVASGITTYQSDNNGTMPDAISGTGTVTISSGASDPNAETARVGGSTAVSKVTSAPTAPITTGTIQVVLGSTCSAATGGSATGSTRAAAIYYSVETSNGNKLRCTDT